MILSSVFMAIQNAFILRRANFLVKEVYSHGGKYSKEVQNIFKEKFGEKRLSDRHCVVALMKKIEQTGSVQDRPRSGLPSVINNEALQNVTNKLDRCIFRILVLCHVIFDE